MQPGSQHVYIEVLPSRLRVSIVRARRVISSRSSRLAAGSAGSSLSDMLTAAADPLREHIESMQAVGLRATVVYASSAAVSLIASMPAALSPGDAEQAAELAIAGIADFPLDDAPTASTRLLSDQPASSGLSGSRQSHALCMADRSECIDDIASWVESAGLRFAGAVPASALAIRGAAISAFKAGRRANDRSAVLWVGEHGSALACVTEGVLRFVRPVAVGLESLVDALCQPLRSQEEGAAELTLDRAAARKLLAETGIPAPDAQLPDLPGFSGASLLPVLQPALQRISIEAKQSLRFGLQEQERAGVRMRIAGPGAALGGLEEWIVRQCGLSAANATGREEESDVISDVLASGPALPVLVPLHMSRETGRRRLRAALAAGVGLAMAWMGVDAAMSYRDLQSHRSQLVSLERAVAMGESTAKLREATVMACSELDRVLARMDNAFARSIDAPAALELVAIAAPEEVRLTTLEIEHSDAGIRCHMSGFVRMSESLEPTKAITGFVDALAAAPIIRDVRLGATQRVRIDGAQSQAFTLAAEFVPLPAARSHIVRADGGLMP